MTMIRAYHLALILVVLKFSSFECNNGRIGSNQPLALQWLFYIVFNEAIGE